MKIGVLTSSRADFGIYFSLLDKIRKDSFFELEIIAFGTHLKEEFGYTINEIEQQGFTVNHKIETSTQNDFPEDISCSIGKTIISFSRFWSDTKFDLVLAFGDRYEMYAAVVAASPFNIDIAHIHAGETTLGAIDNAYRHSISLLSKYLFVTTDEYKNRAQHILGKSENVFNVGALSIDNLMRQEFFTKDEFLEEFDINIDIPSILCTFHPETVNYEKNEEYIDELINTFESLKKEYQIIITMPNSDTMGNMIRKKINEFCKGENQVKVIESFGMKGYLTCMKYCVFLLGNTSSGFVETAFFPKWVINLGKRQDGRIITENIINSAISKESILLALNDIKNRTLKEDINIYGNGKASEKIISTIKHIYNG